MTVGRGITKADIDQRLPLVIEGVWNSLNLANQAALWLANTTIIPNDAFLTGLTYTQAEVTLLRAAINDLGSASGLWGVAHGQSHPTGNNNFFFNAQQLTGVNYTG